MIDDALNTSRLIPPGSTERCEPSTQSVIGTDDRMVIPFPRIYLSPERLAQPIPSLSNRQYVVDKSRKSANQLKTERELFWYRNTLLDKLHCTWLEPGSNRSGHLNLRGQGLRGSLLEVLKREELGIVLNIPGGIKTAEFTELSTRIINHLGESHSIKQSMKQMLMYRTPDRSEDYNRTPSIPRSHLQSPHNFHGP